MRCGAPDRAPFMVPRTFGLCDWVARTKDATRRPSCLELFVHVSDLRAYAEDDGFVWALKYRDAWAKAGFPVPPPRFVKPQIVMRSPSWRVLSSGTASEVFAFQVTLGSYNQEDWFPLEPHL